MGRKRKSVAPAVLLILGYSIIRFYQEIRQEYEKTSERYSFNSIYDRYSRLLTKEENEMLKQKMAKAKQDLKYILFWYENNKNGTLPHWDIDTCGHCLVTSDRSMITNDATGAVVFLYKKITRESMPPLSTRRQDQLHVWYTAEASASLRNMRRLSLSFEDEYHFNLTQTYRRDSGIYHPYGDIADISLRKMRGGKDIYEKIMKNKTKLAAAVVSNCDATPGAVARLGLLQAVVETGFDVDTFGRCFSRDTIAKNEAHAFEYSLNKYKFYFAFENSYHCRDYVTEKFFINGFRAGTVPVAWGAKKEEYEALAPKDSFIFAEDFNSVQDLVDYLNYLDKNDTAYLEYFKWYQRPLDPGYHPERKIRFCQLCRQIHGINVDDIFNPAYDASGKLPPLFTDGIAKRLLPSLKNWYYGSEYEDCFLKDAEEILTRSNFNNFKHIQV